MAQAVLVGAVAGDAVSKLSDAIIHVINQTWYFKSKLLQIQDIIMKFMPAFEEIDKLSEELDKTKRGKEAFISKLRDGEKLVRECEHIKWNIYKRYTHSEKLDEFNASFLAFCQIDIQILITEDLKSLRRDTKDLLEKMDVKNRKKKNDQVPCLNSLFKEQLKDLKAMVLKESVVVVAAARGCGKTTLVRLLMDDHDIQAEFSNIYYVTISSAPNLKDIIEDLLHQSHHDKKFDFINEEIAIKQWRSFVSSRRILLILDDVWSDSIVKIFRFRSPRIKIVATSRRTFQQFSTYHLLLLNHQDAIDLFCHFAFPEPESENANIPDALVEEMVTRCKGHPLTLRLVAGFLVNKDVAIWEGLLKRLSDELKLSIDTRLVV